MLTQNQSHTVDDATTGKTLKGSGLKKYKPGIVKATKIKKPDLTAKNELDIEEAMDKLKGNDPKLDTLNLNNHADVTPEILEEVIKQLETNTSLQRLYLANTRMTDRVAKVGDILLTWHAMWWIVKNFLPSWKTNLVSFWCKSVPKTSIRDCRQVLLPFILCLWKFMQYKHFKSKFKALFHRNSI